MARRNTTDPDWKVILDTLIKHGNRGVCASTFERMHIGRAAARIGELRDDGWKISSYRWCDEHNHQPTRRRIRYIIYDSIIDDSEYLL